MRAPVLVLAKAVNLDSKLQQQGSRFRGRVGRRQRARYRNDRSSGGPANRVSVYGGEQDVDRALLRITLHV